MSDIKGIAINTDGHLTWLKWHRGHRQAGDISFTRQRIAEGMALGASVEIDLVCFAGDGFAVLHDEVLHPATTGEGAVSDASADYLRSLYLRDGGGRPTDNPVMLIDDLGRLLEEIDCRNGKEGFQLIVDFRHAGLGLPQRLKQEKPADRASKRNEQQASGTRLDPSHRNPSRFS